MTDIDGPGLYLDLEAGRIMAMVVGQDADDTLQYGPKKVLGAAGDEMALCYDASDGTAHKLGLAAPVAEYARVLAASLGAHGFREDEIQIRVVTFPATEENLAAASACWNRTGTACDFAARFPAEPEVVAGPKAPGR